MLTRGWFLAVGFLVTGSALAEVPGQFHFIKEISLGNAEGGWDYLVVDSVTRRLYMSQSKRVVVVDIDQDKLAGEISDTPGVHGIALAPQLNRAFTSNGKEGKVSVADLSTLKTLSKLEAGDNPDAILFNPDGSEVYAFNGKSKSVSILSASGAQAGVTLGLPGKPEFAAVDPQFHRVFVNVEDKNVVNVIDTQQHKVVGEWKLPSCDEPTGMAIDLKLHRIFVGCHSQQMLMLDAKDGKLLSSVPIGKGVDAVVFDPELNLVLSSNSEGTVTVAHVEGDGKLTRVQTLKTEKGARTLALDTKTHRVYLPSAKFEAPATGAVSQRPVMVPGTLKLLVYGI